MDADSGADEGVVEDVEFVVLGGPGDGPTLRLDHERFAYAGKFVMGSTGKAVARTVDDARVVAADDENEVEAADGAGGADGTNDDGGEHDEDYVLAAVAFDRDRTDPQVLRIRYVTVRQDRRGEGFGPRLLAFVSAWAMGDGPGASDGVETAAEPGIDGGSVREVRIAVNNPFAYEAAYRAGFGYTDERTGLAELVCARPGDRSPERYRDGLAAFRDRESLGAAERAFLAERDQMGPPPIVDPPAAE